jgi:hypothetical protein
MKICLLRKLLLKSLFTLIIFALVSLHAQAIIQWDKTIGSPGEDILYSVEQTADGGYILGGRAASNAGGDKSENSKGTTDYWVVKLSSDGTKEWDKTIGSAESDAFEAIHQTADGGYILGGTSAAGIGGDKSEGSYGDQDYWVVRLDKNGNKLWDKTIGGSSIDRLADIRQAPDGGFILAGSSMSDISGSKTANTLGFLFDFWVVKLNANGGIVWDKTLGTNGNDYATCMTSTKNGGYVIAGYQAIEQKNSGYYMIKVTADGTKEWDRTVGGEVHADGNTSGYAEILDIQQTPDDGFILGGWAIGGGPSGDRSEYAIFDYWIVKLNADLSVAWDNVLGTPYVDGGKDENTFAKLAQTSDGGYLLTGSSKNPAGGDKSEDSYYANSDFWVVKLDASGTLVWDKTIGGGGNEFACAVGNTADGGFILGGSSNSNISFEKTKNSQGARDYWLVKLAPEGPTLPYPSVRINAGGAAFTASGGRQFMADQYFSGIDRTSSISSGDILNTTDDAMYRSGRCSPNFIYSIPVSNGEINVILHFAETWFGAPGRGPGGAGKRQFNVDIQDTRRLTDFDIYAEAGGAMRAIQRSFPVTVTNRRLTIQFYTGAADLPRVSAIEIVGKNTILMPVADAYVQDGNYSAVNYGSAANLEIKNVASGTSLRRSSYLRFQLPQAAAITSAKLRVYGHNHENAKDISLHAYGVNNDTWTENGIIKNNAPAASTASLGYAAVNNVYKYYEIDVTSYVQAQHQSGDALVSLLLADPNNRNTRLIFNSKENGSYPPELVLQTEPVANSTARKGLKIPLTGPDVQEMQESVIYPNPVKHQFTVALSMQHAGQVSFELFSKSGKRFSILNAEIVRPGEKTEMDISKLSVSSGIHMLKIKSDTFTEVVKMLVIE